MYHEHPLRKSVPEQCEHTSPCDWRQHPDKEVELWREDEAQLGLKPVARRAWAIKGPRPSSSGRHRFEFVCGFAHQGSGHSRFRMLPKANAECMGQALAGFARWVTPGRRKVPVLILDGSGGHTVQKLVVPPNAVLHRQPPCAPELQPAEHL